MAIFGDIRSVTEQAQHMPRLRTALKFVGEVWEGGKADLRDKASALKAGESFEVAIDGKDVFAIVQAYAPRLRQEGFFEAHKHYTDVQFLFEGEEYIEVCELQRFSASPVYDANENVFFPIGEPGGTQLLLKPGTAAVLFPSDAHAPTLKSGPDGGLNIKVVVKVRNALA